MGVVRVLVWSLGIGALIIAGWDVYRSYRASADLLTTSVRDLWVWVGLPDPSMLRGPTAAAWPFESLQNVAGALLDTPATLLLASVGAVLWLIGRRRRRLIPMNTDEQGQKQDLGAADKPPPHANRTGPSRRPGLLCEDP